MRRAAERRSVGGGCGIVRLEGSRVETAGASFVRFLSERWLSVCLGCCCWRPLSASEAVKVVSEEAGECIQYLSSAQIRSDQIR